MISYDISIHISTSNLIIMKPIKCSVVKTWIMLFKEERSEVSEFDWGLTAIGDVADDDSLKASSNEPLACWFSDLDCLVVEITRSCGYLGCVGVLGCWVLNILVTSLLWGNLASWSGGGCGLLVLQGNCQGVVGAELAVSGSARGATLFVASFNGGGRCFVRATVFVHPLPNEVFVPVTGALGLVRSTGGSGSRTPFRRAAKPGSRPGRGTAPPRATFSPRAPGLPAPPGAARTGPPCKVAACFPLEEVARGPLKPRLRILMACARDSLEIH